MNASLSNRSVAALCCATLLACGAFWFPSAGRDDVHISYWSAHMLASEGTILNYSGLPLEQSSSLLHVVLLAFAHALTRLPLPDLGAMLSILFGLAAVIETGRLARRLAAADAAWAMAFAATAVPLVYWSFGALETTLVTFLVTASQRALLDALEATPRQPLRQALLWTSLYLLARPEAWFVISAMTLALFVLRGADQRASARLLAFWAIATLVAAALAAWRLQQFGQWLPQPVYAKVSGHVLDAIVAGLGLLGRTARQCPGVVLLALAAGAGALLTLRDPARRPRYAVPVAFIAAQGAFLLASGGDWMEGGRFVAPMVPALAVLAAAALGRLPWPRYGRGAMIAAALLGQLWFAWRWSTSIWLPQYAGLRNWAIGQALEPDRFSFFELANRVHLRDALFLPFVAAAIDERLQRGAPVVLMSAQAGLVPFHLLKSRFGRVRFVDMAGLTSREFANCAVLKRELPVRVAGGIGMDYDFYLTHREALERECAVPRPDLIFDLDDPGFPRVAALERAGYARRAVQALPVCAPGQHCAPSLRAPMFVVERVDP